MPAVDRINGYTGTVAIKLPCAIVTTSNITKSGLVTIGTYTTQDGDRVLQAVSGGHVDNGVWICSDSGTWARSPDFDGPFDVATGTIVPVLRLASGSSSYHWWKVTNTGDFTIGDDAITLDVTQFDAAQLEADLAASSGAGLVGFADETVQSALSSGVKNFSTIAALRANTNSLVTSAGTFGYYTAGDGGGSLYYMDSSDTTTLDDGATCIVDAGARRWKLNHNGAISFLQCGAKSDGGVTDCTPFLNAYLDSTVSRLDVPAGAFYFKTQPDDIARKVHISGSGPSTSLFYRDYNGSTNHDGLLNFRNGANGSLTEGLGILSVSGRSGGNLISLVAVLAGAPDFCHFKKLYLSTTGTSTHSYAVWIDGTARTGAPIGVRDTFFEGCSIFGGAFGAVYCSGAIAPHFTACDTFPAGGASGRLVLTGTVGVPTYYAHITAGTVAGMSLDNTIYATVIASAYTDAITNSSSAQYVTLIGSYFASTPQQFWTNSTVISRSNTMRAWVNFNGTGTPAIRSAVNVSSITDLGVGNYRITFTEPIGNTDYAVTATIGGGTVSALSASTQITAQTSDYVEIQVGSDGAGGGTYTAQDATTVCVMVASL
jgi:hypothetical protein